HRETSTERSMSRSPISIRQTRRSCGAKYGERPPRGFPKRSITGEAISSYNDFGKPESVTIKPFTGAHMQNGILMATLPARSVVTLTIK
ncbi:MAG TPA: hypothetical protein VGA55_02415, partial [Bacteroidota bacterium]